MERRNAVPQFSVASLRHPEFSHPTSTGALSPPRTPPGDFIPTTAADLDLNSI
jgi:hypothetical protein